MARCGPGSGPDRDRVAATRGQNSLCPSAVVSRKGSRRIIPNYAMLAGDPALGIIPGRHSAAWRRGRWVAVCVVEKRMDQG